MLDRVSRFAPDGAPTMNPERRAGPAAEATTNRKNMALLVQLRWMAVLGQIAAILFVHHGLGIPLPVWPMSAVVGGLILLNVGSVVWIRRRSDVTNRQLFVALTIDVAALTAQLYLSGGITNSFVLLYLLQVVLGAVLLDVRSAWTLVALACACLAGLSLFHHPLAWGDLDAEDILWLRTAGLFIGFVLDAVLVVVFVARINRNLRERDERLAALRRQAVEEEHIVRMGLLASGAAHELGTPLGSMSVIVSDWRRMPALTGDPDIVEDIAEMEASLRRCKRIVTGILLSAGEMRGEGSSPTTVNGFLSGLVGEWRAARVGAVLAFTNRFGRDIAIVSDEVLKQAVVNLLDNAVEASPHGVELVASRDGDRLVLGVNDRGPGFAGELLPQIGKPYNSSKGRPGGGLGLFLVVNVVRKLGGEVRVRNRRGGGASVTVILPLKSLEIGGDGGA
ncbi:MAG: HAMP domain-containing histidine kinase [Xanthobacteraceae bacterium]|nr:HAMP domain-containing histidine kinase [Xanthobacteraceae bacterium]